MLSNSEERTSQTRPIQSNCSSASCFANISASIQKKWDYVDCPAFDARSDDGTFPHRAVNRMAMQLKYSADEKVPKTGGCKTG